MKAMTPENFAQPTLVSRVSILARLVPAPSCAIPMLGGAVSALMFFGVLRAMRSAECAGVAAVAGGMAEANIAAIVALYLGAFIGSSASSLPSFECLCRRSQLRPPHGSF